MNNLFLKSVPAKISSSELQTNNKIDNTKYVTRAELNTNAITKITKKITGGNNMKIYSQIIVFFFIYYCVETGKDRLELLWGVPELFVVWQQISLTL